MSLDEYINLKDRVENRMVIADLAATARRQPPYAAEHDMAFRRGAAPPAPGGSDRIRGRRTGVSITDLGLNDFRMDLLAYVKEYGDLASSPKGLHAVVPADPDRGLHPGVVFALRSVADGAVVNKHNRLHPYYLVYLDDDGEVIADHTEVKALLDLIRQSCHGHNEPIAAVCRIFNEATAEGAEMGHYSELLTSAIGSLISVTEERDIDSLFAGAQTTALAQRFTSLDDFELVAFLACRPSGGWRMTALFRWPAAAKVGRELTKERLYREGAANASVRRRFIDEVQHVRWAYKLGEESVHLRGSDDVPEVQVFEVDLKGDDLSDSVLASIDKAVPSPIIFELHRTRAGRHEVQPVAARKQRGQKGAKVGDYLHGAWTVELPDRDPLPPAIDLPGLYTQLMLTLLPIAARRGEDLSSALARVAAPASSSARSTRLTSACTARPSSTVRSTSVRQLRACKAELDTLLSLTAPPSQETQWKN